MAVAASAQQTVETKPKALTVRPAASPSATATNLPSEDVVNAFMREMFGYDPSVSWKIADIRPSKAAGLAEVTVTVTNAQGQQINKFLVTSDGTHAVTGEIIPFGPHPFTEISKELREKAKGPSKGPAGAPVTIVEFSDLQCPHCKATQPTIDKLVAEDPNVRLVFQSFPLPTHDWAEKAAEYADCVGQQSGDAFWKFIQGVYDAQADITASSADEKLTDLADKSGVKGSEVATCAAKPETTGRVQGSVLLGKSLDVNSTPTAFVNGRKLGVGGIPYDVLKKLVDYAAQEAK